MELYDYNEGMRRREQDTRTLGSAFLEQVRKNPGKTAVVDIFGAISRIKMAGAALAMFDLLALEADEQNVGIVLPPGKGGAIVNLCLALAGKTSVNINHTAGATQIKRMCEIADVRTIISAQAYLDKIDYPELPGRVVLADKDLLPKVSKLTVIGKMIKVRFGSLKKLDKGKKNEVATILFSSGTTGDPKGVQLTHAQMLAHGDSLFSAYSVDPKDDILVSALPLFHSYGLIPGLWNPLILGLTVGGYPNPRDAQNLGKFTRDVKGTFMVSTPTFCRTYMKRIPAEHFATLKFINVGAEKAPKEMRDAFRKHFNTEVLEGYGCTELAPVVSANLKEEYVQGVYETGVRDNRVGRPLPGIQILIVHPESHEILATGEEGLVVVRSPARMLGYLKRDDLTEKAFILDGYNTGDIGKLDKDGFLFITGRLSRFAKIGGEMVPLDKVELAMQDFLTANYGEEPLFAIAAICDEHKGEKLVVLHNGLPCGEDDVLGALREFPALWQPKKTAFYKVDEIPVLGTGKRDLKGLKILAEKVAAKVTAG